MWKGAGEDVDCGIVIAQTRSNQSLAPYGIEYYNKTHNTHYTKCWEGVGIKVCVSIPQETNSGFFVPNILTSPGACIANLPSFWLFFIGLYRILSLHAKFIFNNFFRVTGRVIWVYLEVDDLETIQKSQCTTLRIVLTLKNGCNIDDKVECANRCM